MRGRLQKLSTISALALAATIGGAVSAVADPWIDVVRKFVPGTFAGYGQDRFPWVVFGPPVPGAPLEGATDVLSLGHGGVIEFTFRDNVVFDGPGDDLVIFENAFYVGSLTGPVFTEYAFVEVSADGREWQRFPVDPETGAGLAGRVPVSAEVEDPLDPQAGGDRFDIGELGLEFVRHVRLIDAGDEIDDFGNNVVPADKGGFDLDAAGAIHSTPPALVHGRVLSQSLPVARALVRLVPMDGGRVKRRRTDAEGRFEFANTIPRGDHRVRARRRGVGAATVGVYVDLAQLDVDVALELHSAR
jgi:hypothetical protein